MLQESSPQPPSSFLSSSPLTSHGSSPSSLTRDRSSSQSTLLTIYSMYDEPRRAHSRSLTPPQVLDASNGSVLQTDVPKAPSTSISNVPPLTSPQEMSTPLSSFSDGSQDSNLPYLQKPSFKLQPPESSDIRPSTAPSAAHNHSRRLHAKPVLPNRRSLQLSPSHSPPNGAQATKAAPLMLDKPTPPTPVETPTSLSQPVIFEPSPDSSEDPDSHYVRSTYARLDITGVRGDGYEEGIELTRARLNAESPSNSTILRLRKRLEPAEIDTLRTLDRYGFYSLPSADRSVMLPKPKPLSVYKSNESAIHPSPKPLSEIPITYPEAEKEQRRIDKWAKMLTPVFPNSASWQVNPQLETKLRERVYKGIPDRWRRAAWDVLISNRGKAPHQPYEHLLSAPSEYDIQIDLDVPRTISGHIMFRTRYGKGQRALFHVLHAFSLHCSQCGYCQGMGPIAATFLCYVEPQKAHDWMCQLHSKYSMHKIFGPGFPGLLENIYVQEKITERFMPGVYNAFRKQMVSTTSYATKWYITLFATSIPFQMQLRVWDAFLLEGMDFIVVAAVAIVWALKDHIIAKTASFETILSLLSAFFVPESEDEFMLWISKVMSNKRLRSDISQWREDWLNLVQKGEEGAALL